MPDTSNHTTKGMFLKSIIKAVEKEKGPEGLKRLEELHGNIKYSGFQDYSMEEEKQLYSKALIVLYGGESPEAWRQFGALAFRTYADSLIGKTMISLIGADIKRLGLTTEKILNTITTGYVVTVEDLEGNNLKLTLEHCPDRMEYFEGVFAEAIKTFGYTSKVTARELGVDHYEYTISWE